MVTTSHRAIAAKEDPALRPYFSVVEENVNKMVVKQIKKQMEKSGFEPSLLDDPDAPLPDQIGSADKALPVEQFEKGLRYDFKLGECCMHETDMAILSRSGGICSF